MDFLIEGGIDGLFVLGTSGEFALLAREERKAVVKSAVDRVNGRVPVFAGVSDPSTENVLHFSADTKDMGADGVIATPPYHSITTNEALYKHFRLVAQKVDLPLMICNIPGWTHVFVPPEVATPLVDEKHIVGMKYTEYDLLNLLRFSTGVGDKISLFIGSDGVTYAALESGGAGAIIGVANVAPKVAAKIFDDPRSGDLQSARDAQLELLPLIQAIGVGKFVGLKEVMKLIGIPVGDAKEPVPRLSSEEVQSVKRYLGEAGVRVEGK